MGIKIIPDHLQMFYWISKHLKLRSRGKVRDCYELGNGLMLSIVTDRCSIFDFILGQTVPQKGEVLNAIDLFFRLNVLQDFQHHLVAYGAGIDKYLPEALQGNKDLQKRAVVVKILEDKLEVEGIVRGCLTGSALEPYQKTGMVCGVKLAEGLQDGDLLEEPVFTPTNKADVGHDDHIDASTVDPRFAQLVLAMYKAGRDYLLTRGILLIDTKAEGSVDCLGDEVLTPDASRYVDQQAYEKHRKAGKKGLPASMDKQYVRDEGKRLGIDKLDPASWDDMQRVYNDLLISPRIIRNTTKIYRYTMWRVTGMTLEQFQRDAMGIEVEDLPRHIEIVIGSNSDRDQIKDGHHLLCEQTGTSGRISTVSCHRNSEELRDLAEEISRLPGNTYVIAGAGMAAALPGVLKALLVKLGRDDIPVIGVAFEGSEEINNVAAQTSIECLPEQPVELDDDGQAYFGASGFVDACIAASECEFRPRGFTAKPAEIGWSCWPAE